MTVRAAAFSAVRWTSVAMLGRAAIAFLQIVLLSRILDPADFRQVAIAITLINVGVVFTDMGISSAIIRFRDLTQIELSSLFWLNVGVGALVTGAIFLASPAIAAFYGDAAITPLVQIASAVFFVTALGQQHRARAEKDLKFDRLCWIDLSSAAAGFAVTLGLALSKVGPASIVIGNLVNAVGVMGLSWALLANGWRPAVTFSFSAARRFIAFGANVVGISMLNSVALNGDVMLAGRLIPGPALGYYFQPRELCMRIMFVVNPIVTRVSFPLLASVAHDRERVKSLYLQAITMTASINFPIYAFLAVFNAEIVEIALGPKWGDSVPLMRALAIWCAVRSVGNPVGSLLFATGETKRATISAFCVMIAVFAATYAGAQFGIIGVPIALTALYAALIPGFWLAIVRPSCGAGFEEYHRVILLPAIATLCACLAGLGALRLLAAEPAIVRLALGGAAGGLAYLAGSWFVNRNWLMALAELLMVDRLVRRPAQ